MKKRDGFSTKRIMKSMREDKQAKAEIRQMKRDEKKKPTEETYDQVPERVRQAG